MAGKRAAIATLGCKVNQYDSAELAGAFQKKGYHLVDFPQQADIYVINTCSVTRQGDRKSRQLIRRAVKANPAAIVAVVGCYAQVASEEALAVPGVDLVLGVQDRNRLVELVEVFQKGGPPVNYVNSLTGAAVFEENAAPPLREKTRAFLKIQDGCDNYCTYCLVPYARGRARSRPPERVIALARELAAAGYKEIVLTGVHIGSYGQDLPGSPTLAGLLRRFLEIPNLPRIRLGSVEPHDITFELVELLSSSPVFCRHLHMPLQSGSENILKKMGRRYTPWEYKSLVGMLKENIPGLGLTTDVIVGFPGETAENFEQTYNLLKKCAFSRLHVFKYSPRPGTPAAGFNGQVTASLKEARSSRLIALGQEMAGAFAASLAGQVLEVLVEGRFEEKNGWHEGLSDNYLRVLFPTAAAVGSVQRVKVEGSQGKDLLGKAL